MEISGLSGLLIAICAGGFYFAYLYGRRTKKFRLIEYIALLSTPLFCVGVLAYQYGIKVLYLFALSAVIGLILEYGVGRLYHKTLNRRLWVYSRYSLGGYTSWLVLPMWGIAGVVFWVLSNKIGL